MCLHGLCNVRDGIPSLSSLQEMDRPSILTVLELCANSDPDKTAKSCCDFLEHHQKLTWEQKQGVMETLLTILQTSQISTVNRFYISNAITKFLQQQILQFSYLEATGCLVLIELARWYPKVVMCNIMSLFGVEGIPHAAVAWCFQRFIELHGAQVKERLGYILTKFLPVMEKAKYFNHRLWFSRAFQSLAQAFALNLEEELVPLLMKGYAVCKAYLEVPCTDITEVHKIRRHVLLTIGHMATLFDPDQLGEELAWVSHDVLKLHRDPSLQSSSSWMKAAKCTTGF
ncbi:maestro heat-like repeat-containing protein family member 1 [Ambystoma mexicanum]|uniref:maestro heat-like repeat-containing protein family member 1 n=1 Tax=Ambystoma mexicanum TaxID=8296 RepID=UPI0037E798BE